MLRVLGHCPTLLVLVLLTLFDFPLAPQQPLLPGQGNLMTAPALDVNSAVNSTNYVLGGANSTRVCASIGGSWDNSSFRCTLVNNFSLNATDSIDVVKGVLAIS